MRFSKKNMWKKILDGKSKFKYTHCNGIKELKNNGKNISSDVYAPCRYVCVTLDWFKCQIHKFECPCSQIIESESNHHRPPNNIEEQHYRKEK